jgi:hypothetical protein
MRTALLFLALPITASMGQPLVPLPRCTGDGPLRVDTLAGAGTRVMGAFPGLYGPGSQRATDATIKMVTGGSTQAYHNTVVLIPASGTDAPARRATIGENERFDLGEVRPGRYFLQMSFVKQAGIAAEVIVDRVSLSLCLSRPTSPATPVGPPPTAATYSASGADSIAVADAVGRYYGSGPHSGWPSDPQTKPSAFPGADEPWLVAARRGFLIALGDSIMPPRVRPTAGPWETWTMTAIRFIDANTAIATTVTAHCWPGGSIGSAGGTDAEVLVTRVDRGIWRVSGGGRMRVSDGVCRG